MVGLPEPHLYLQPAELRRPRVPGIPFVTETRAAVNIQLQRQAGIETDIPAQVGGGQSKEKLEIRPALAELTICFSLLLLV